MMKLDDDEADNVDLGLDDDEAEQKAVFNQSDIYSSTGGYKFTVQSPTFVKM